MSSLPIPSCFDFEELSLNKSYAVGEALTEDGVIMTVAAYQRPEGSLYSGTVNIFPQGFFSEVGQSLALLGAFLHFDFGGAVSRVSLRYANRSRENYVEVNRDSRYFRRFTEIVDKSSGIGTLGGVELTVEDELWDGALALNGDIRSLTLGSRELLVIDDVCFS